VNITYLLWGKYISLHTKKQIFCTVVESTVSYGCEIWTVDYRLKKKLLSTEIDFWRRAARTSKILKVRNGIIREKWSNTNNSGKNAKQRVKIAWTFIRHDR
jgi:hypothetical protein